MLRLIAVLCLAAACSLAGAAAPKTVRRGFADKSGRVHIVTYDGRDLPVPLEKGQDGVDQVQVAQDGETVGWLVERWDSCCVSYAIPTELVVWRSGRVLRRLHSPMAIWSWSFQENGACIAYRMSPLHGGWLGEFVLVDIATGKTLATWDHPVNENGNDTDDNTGEPEWAQQLH